MTCKNCEREQELLIRRYYFRVGISNILVYGCDKHMKQLRDKLRGVSK
jgi:hypothetical protein